MALNRKQRKKLMATIAKQKALGLGWGRGRKKPYHKPGRIHIERPDKREVVIRIALV
jgi:hypothetical protein